MSQMPTPKSHSDPIKYHAYGKVKGFYRPSAENLRQGKFITEDGTTFTAALYGEALERVTKHPAKLNQIGIWRCFFRTRPSSLCLTRVKFDNFDYTGKNQVDNFVVEGQVVQVVQDRVKVLIKSNKGPGKPFHLSLKGTFAYEPSHRFYRFELRREGKSYRIVKYRQVGLSAQTNIPEKKAPQKKATQKKTPSQPQKLVIVGYIRKKT